jgi:alpha-beta hydrolase superfamily lysophospholipase
LGIGFLDDLENRKEKLNLIRAAQRIRVPWLILHGKADGLVLLDKIDHLYNASAREEDNYQTLNKLLT